MCFDNQITTIIYCKYSQTSFVRTPINRNPCYPKQIAKNRFLPMHFTPLIWKPCCPSPTRKLRNFRDRPLFSRLVVPLIMVEHRQRTKSDQDNQFLCHTECNSRLQKYNEIQYMLC